jgi:cytochrome c oxidase assembly factor CtaG
MPDMHMMLPPLTWRVFFSTWQWQPVWSAVVAATLLGYLLGFVRLRRRGAGQALAPARALSFVLGLGLLLVSVSSAIETYSHLLFWDHMIRRPCVARSARCCSPVRSLS